MRSRSSWGRDSRREAGMVGTVVAVVGTGRVAWVGIEDGGCGGSGREACLDGGLFRRPHVRP
jgi:hypothetical protein